MRVTFFNFRPILTKIIFMMINFSVTNGFISIIFKEICRNLELRGGQSAFSPSASQTVVFYDQSHIWLRRQSSDQRIFVVASFSAETTKTALVVDESLPDIGLDILRDENVHLHQAIAMAPYQVRWISVPQVSP